MNRGTLTLGASLTNTRSARPSFVQLCKLRLEILSRAGRRVMAELGQVVVGLTPPSECFTGSKLLHSSYRSKQRLAAHEIETALLGQGQPFVTTASRAQIIS